MSDTQYQSLVYKPVAPFMDGRDAPLNKRNRDQHVKCSHRFEAAAGGVVGAEEDARKRVLECILAT